MMNHKQIMMSRLIYKRLITKFLKNVLNIKRQNKSLLKQLANLNLER
jgi:RAB protein geranylgeranyltransferase component A